MESPQVIPEIPNGALSPAPKEVQVQYLPLMGFCPPYDRYAFEGSRRLMLGDSLNNGNGTVSSSRRPHA